MKRLGVESLNRELIKNTKRVVIKIGTNSIMKSPLEVDYRQLDRMAFVCTSLRQSGIEVVLVTSGAIGVGASLMKLNNYPQTIPDQQAISSIGQTTLMTLYSQFFNHYNQYVGQILFTKDVIEFPTSYKNMQNALNRLLEKNIIPIINENDAIAVDELNHETKFGDNDTLSAYVARTINADLLVILSDVDGLYDANPAEHSDAQLIAHVPEIDEKIRNMASGKGSEFATGGMATKLRAAEIMLENDRHMVIANAKDPRIVFEVLEGKNVGTLFGQ
jgi:glutamate 5-kinase